MMKTRWVILASGEGTTVEFLERAPQPKNFEIVGLVTNKKEAGIVSRAKSLRLPIQIIENISEESQKLSLAVESYQPDFVLAAGFLKMIPPSVIEKFKGRIFNTHPSLLPKFGGAGMYGANVHKAVFSKKEKWSGVTVHEASEEYDRGRIVFQEAIDVSSCNSWEEIEEIVKQFEKELLLKCLNKKKVEWTGG